MAFCGAKLASYSDIMKSYPTIIMFIMSLIVAKKKKGEPFGSPYMLGKGGSYLFTNFLPFWISMPLVELLTF